LKVCVFGAGSIGSLFAAFLSKNNEVFVVCRKEHADAINSNGLNVTGIETFTLKIKAYEKAPSEKVDLLIISTKAHDTQQALSQSQPLISPKTAILLLQNGYGQQPENCLICLTSMGASLTKPGTVDFTGRGETIVDSKTISENFTSCGIENKVSKNIEADIFKKLAVNAAINSVGTILEMTNGELIKSTAARALMHGIADECESVLNKKGIKISGSFERALEVAASTSKNKNSMLQDIEAGRKTEIDYINGAICKIGSELNMQTPLNNFAVNRVKELE